MVTFTRPTVTPPAVWCELVEVTGGSVLTRCRGRFAEGERHERWNSPPEGERCKGCRLEAGVQEMRHARATTPLPWRPSGVCEAFDVTDEGES